MIIICQRGSGRDPTFPDPDRDPSRDPSDPSLPDPYRDPSVPGRPGHDDPSFPEHGVLELAMGGGK